MMELEIDVVMDRLTGYLDIFDEIVRHGLSTYEKLPPEIAIDYDSSTQAHCTFRHILQKAHADLDDLPNVEHFDIRGQNLWLFKEANAVVRFKKMDENGISSNFRTPQQNSFDDGEELSGLPQTPTRLTVGYLLDQTGTSFLRTQVSLPTKNGALWCAAIIPNDMRESADQAWYEVTKQRSFGGF
jgi:hypothetical protein